MRSPQISKELFQVDGFSTYIKDFLKDELPIYAIKSCNEGIENTNFFKLDLQKSIFENCTFHHCNFDHASFIDVIFKGCDFSNSKLMGAYFERCRFVNCKCIGTHLQNTIIKHTTFEHSNLQYSVFDKAKIMDVLFEHTDFTEASMVEATLKRFETRGSRFIKNNFFKTMLAAVDFTDNEFTAPIVSSPPIELKGVIVNMFQAADLIGLWGVVVNH